MLCSDDLPAGFEDLRGETFASHYAVDELLAASPRRVLYSAEDQRTEQRVVVRLYRPTRLHDDALREHFERQIEACSQLRHPVLVRPTDSGTLYEGTRFVVSRHPRGELLEHHLSGRSAHRLSWADARPLLLGLVQGLSTAHARQLVHGTLTPDSCWVDDEGATPTIQLLDLGLDTRAAVPTGEHSSSRTNAVYDDPQFMAPETIAGATVDAQTDLYLVGLVAHVMLTGQPPFLADDNARLASMHLHEDIPPLSRSGVDVPPALQSLLASMLAKDPQQRPEGMAAVEHALLELGPRQADKPRPSRRPTRSKRATGEVEVQSTPASTPNPSPPSPASEQERTTTFRRSDLARCVVTIGCSDQPVDAMPPVTVDDEPSRSAPSGPVVAAEQPPQPPQSLPPVIADGPPHRPPPPPPPAFAGAPPQSPPPVVVESSDAHDEALDGERTIALRPMRSASPTDSVHSTPRSPLAERTAALTGGAAVANSAAAAVAIPPVVAASAVALSSARAPAAPATDALSASPTPAPAPAVALHATPANTADPEATSVVTPYPVAALPPGGPPSGALYAPPGLAPGTLPPTGAFPPGAWAPPAPAAPATPAAGWQSGSMQWPPPGPSGVDDSLVTRREHLSLAPMAVSPIPVPAPVPASRSTQPGITIGVWALAIGLVAAAGLGVGLTLVLS